MMIVKFKSSEEHESMLKKVKKMKKFAAELEDCLEEALEDDIDYRRHDEDDDDEDEHYRRNSRYDYRRGGSRMR